jgi:metal-responsive CopG/Arc/MetJ family transcriptional regulator
MATEQLLLRLPEDLVRRFRQVVPERKRSEFVRTLLEQALREYAADDADPLYLAALAVEQDKRLTAEMMEWEDATVGDGLDQSPPQ